MFICLRTHVWFGFKFVSVGWLWAVYILLLYSGFGLSVSFIFRLLDGW